MLDLVCPQIFSINFWVLLQCQAVSSSELGAGYNPLKSSGDDLLYNPHTQPASASKKNGINFGTDPGYGQIFDFFNVQKAAAVATA